MANYKVNINQSLIEVSAKDIDALDLSPESSGYHILQDGIAYKAQVIQAKGKEITLRLNGTNYTCTISDTLDQLIDEMGMNTVAVVAENEIKAPMPGIILDILVKEGQDIEVDTPLLILEAMKMENVIKSAGAGKVASINFAKGEKVDKNVVLIELEV